VEKERGGAGGGHELVSDAADDDEASGTGCRKKRTRRGKGAAIDWYDNLDVEMHL
jgi:hypothetical protein